VGTDASRGSTPNTNAIFQQPWWLEALAPGRWGEAVVERNGRTVARLPYVVRGAGPLRLLTQPPLTQTLGPWVEPSAAKPANALADEIELLTDLEAALPRAQAFVQLFSPTMLNALPFFWAGYRIEVAYTYRLEVLEAEDTLWDGLRGNIRREIRKARRRVEVREDLGLDRFHAACAKTFARQGLPVPWAAKTLERLDEACSSRGARTMLFAVDESDRVHAVSYIVWDDRAAYYLLGGGDPELRTSGAASLLMWEAIMRARSVTDVFDFEGSMLKPVERFFRAFGARQTPYLRVSRATAPAQAALSARTAWRRVVASQRAQARGAGPWVASPDGAHREGGAVTADAASEATR
jgi:hypothetical protein